MSHQVICKIQKNFRSFNTSEDDGFFKKSNKFHVIACKISLRRLYVRWLVVCVLWYINLCRLLNLQMNSFISNNSVRHKYVVPSISFLTYFVQAFKIVVDFWKLLLPYIFWDDRPIFYDFRFKWTATAVIRIHPTKAWLSQLVNFQNAIWTWGRTICNKILF